MDEDLLLISAWLNISKDPITGIDQDGAAFWMRINNYIAQHSRRPWERCLNAAKNRFHRFNRPVTKFNGIYQQFRSKNPSGHVENDLVEAAMRVWSEDNNDKLFSYRRHWKILRIEPKWAVIDQPLSSYSSPPTATSSKRPSTDSNHEVDAEFGGTETSPAVLEDLPRPEGVKAEKKKSKVVASCSGSRFSEEEILLLSKYNDLKEAELEVRRMELTQNTEQQRLAQLALEEEREAKLEEQRRREREEREKDNPDFLWNKLDELISRDTSRYTQTQQRAHELLVIRIMKKLGVYEGDK